MGKQNDVSHQNNLRVEDLYEKDIYDAVSKYRLEKYKERLEKPDEWYTIPPWIFLAMLGLAAVLFFHLCAS